MFACTGWEIFAASINIHWGIFFVAFFKGWLLTLVLLSSIPLLAAFGGLMYIIISKTASRGQNAYANATNIVEQTIGSIRTVCHVVKLSTCLRKHVI